MTSCKPTKEEHIRKPDWLKIKLNTNEEYKSLKKLMREKNLHTVCGGSEMSEYSRMLG